MGIARTIALEPKLVICDESVSALDISVQAQVLNLLNELKDDFSFTYLFISHDLALVSEIANRVLVMYKGDIVETGTVIEIFKNPKDEYTKALLASRPTLEKRLEKLPTIASIADSSFVPIVETSQSRAKKHKKIYTQTPLLEVKNLEKEYYSNGGFFKPNQSVKAVSYTHLTLPTKRIV